MAFWAVADLLAAVLTLVVTLAAVPVFETAPTPFVPTIDVTTVPTAYDTHLALE